MSYDEEQQKRSRVVVETPTARREVVHQQSVRYPEERRGHSTGIVVAVALVAVAATAVAVIVQTPMTMPTPQTIIIQQPPPTTTVPAPVIVTQPPAASAPPPTSSAPPASGRAAANGRDDASLQEKLDKAFAADPDVSAATINATVVNGRVILVGTVGSDAVKQRAERLAYQIKGVLGVDNKIVVSP